jgi:GNAT superfamily N-acetyltransferase
MAPGYELTGDRQRIDPAAAHAYLTRSYWAEGIDLDTVRRAIGNSLCVAVLHESEQVGFARAISDVATFAYVADVYVVEAHRGKGLGHALLDWLHEHPLLQGLERWVLFTRDAHGLYAQHGWTLHPYPERAMVRRPLRERQ